MTGLEIVLPFGDRPMKLSDNSVCGVCVATPCVFGLIPAPKPLHQAAADPQQLGRCLQTNLPSPNLRQHQQPLPLPTTHRNYLHFSPPFFCEGVMGAFLLSYDTRTVPVLDIFHALAYGWKAAGLFERDDACRKAFTRERLLRILCGEVRGVIRRCAGWVPRRGHGGRRRGFGGDPRLFREACRADAIRQISVSGVSDRPWSDRG